MKQFFANLLALSVILFTTQALAADDRVVRMATTTSTENSGLFAVIQPVFEQALGIKVNVIAVGTGKALEMARRGDVDVVLVHAKPAEEAFVAAGYGVQRHEIMYNDFIIVGPEEDIIGVGDQQDASQVLARIAAVKAVFVSRGDDSGTQQKEQALWQQAGIKPLGRWYNEVGQGMGKTLQIAGEMQAYTLVDRGTWLAYRKNIPLALSFAGGAELKNAYGIIAVNPKKFPDVNYADTQRLIDWFQTKAAHELITGFQVDGEQLFYPVSN
jgi:tungstate transport system substrate-binding protein